MKRTLISTTIGTLALALAPAVLASPAPSAGMHASPQAQTTQPSPTTSSVASAKTTQPTTSSTTTTRGPSQTGQPNQNCETLGNQPGNSMSAPGSAFNPDGKAGSVYAGTQPQNSRNTASVSQYDVACARPSH